MTEVRAASLHAAIAKTRRLINVQTTQSRILLDARETWRIQVRMDWEGTGTATKTDARRIHWWNIYDRCVATSPLAAGDPARGGRCAIRICQTKVRCLVHAMNVRDMRSQLSCGLNDTCSASLARSFFSKLLHVNQHPR